MGSLPSGTVTFLFTDIEGSTERWERHPRSMAAALAHHDALMRAAVESHSGTVFKTVGDAVCAAFATAPEALAAAIDAQRALATEDWSRFGPAFEPLRVRMGLHTGAAEERDGDYFGPPLNRCARLQSAGHGGQVLVSLATQQLLRDRLDSGVELRDLGAHRLKDLRYPERIYLLVAKGLPVVDKAPLTIGRTHVGDRILVDAKAEPRDLDEILTALKAVVHDSSASARLTPAQVRQIVEHHPADLEAYWLGRIAEWSQHRYRIDGRFVTLEILVDQGEETTSDRWQAADTSYPDLATLIDDMVQPAIVLLGPPGSGKSTLMRRLELDLAIRALSAEAGPGGPARASAPPISFLVELNHYKPARIGKAPPAPADWLAERWAHRYPDLPCLSELLAAGRVVLLLDALNEVPLPSETEFRTAVGLWKDWLHQEIVDTPGNRVIFSCRSLDYSQPLSTPVLRVPQVRIKPLSDRQVRSFLKLHSPAHAREIWERLRGSRRLEVLRSPYFLKLLTEQVEQTGEIPRGRAGLFTGFVRHTMRREVELENPLFAPDGLLTSRDLRRLTHWQWRQAWDLPERGRLIRKLAELAFRMQEARPDGERSQVRIDYDAALALLDDPCAEDIVRAGEALSVLDEDPAADELMFLHQLLQEYFAGRELSRTLDPEILRGEWRADALVPRTRELLGQLDPADPLPVLPQTGWEETTLLASTMAQAPSAFLRAVMSTNLKLAARCAVQPDLCDRLPEGLLDELRGRLVQRLSDPEADLRERIACGHALGELGDPRFDRCLGPMGEYLLPPLLEIPGGVYPIGDDQPIEWSWVGEQGRTSTHVPRHELELRSFWIARYSVTNAEWSRFMAAGGYADERWWDTAAGRAWRLGELANEGAMANSRTWRQRFHDEPRLLERMAVTRRFASKEIAERWRRWMRLDEAEFEAAMTREWKARRETEPRYWRDPRFNGPNQPVVGICWYEARAYCAWLAAQSGRPFRLPTEVEWEASARGKQARRFAYGAEFDRLAGNTLETQVKRSTPVGVFVHGLTPEGAADMSGNVFEWTSSLLDRSDAGEAGGIFGYPYCALDGREDAEAGPGQRRVLRGGSWNANHSGALAACRGVNYPDRWVYNYGLRVAVTAEAPS